MLRDRLEIINEQFFAATVDPTTYDILLADAWRHFGSHFFRYNFGIFENEIRRVIPLRIRLTRFTPSKSQRRVLRRNADLKIDFRPIEITAGKHDLFEHHKQRFTSGVPDSLFDFLSRDAAKQPTAGYEVTARRDRELLAASYFDIGESSISAIYGTFNPLETSRSLGIFTMLKVIEYALASGKTFYYHGYAYEGHSYYDYKKRFSGLEQYDWSGSWSCFKL